MKRPALFLGMIIFCMGLPAAFGEGFPDARDETIDFHVHPNPKNSVNVLSKLPAETIKMMSKLAKGALKLNPAKLDAAEGSFVVPFSSLEMPRKEMKSHMLGAQWIEADKYPDATFTISGIEKPELKKKAVRATLKGKMSIHGVEKEMSVPVTMVYTQDAKKDSKKDHLSIRAKFDIKLADFGIKGRDGSPNNGKKGVADAVQLTVNLSLGVGDPPQAAAPKPRELPRARAN